MNPLLKVLYRFGLIPTQKQSPYSFGANVSPRWSMRNYSAYYREGYAGNSLIFEAVMTKARAVTQANLVAAFGTHEKPEVVPSDVSNKLSALLKRPNPYMSNDFYNLLQEVFLCLTGNTFAYVYRDGTTPTQLWPLRPDKVSIIPSDDGIMGYQYEARIGKSVLFLSEDIIHVKYPNPSDELNGLGFGLSPLASIAKIGDVDNMITDFLNIMFQQGAMPPGFISFDQFGLEDWQIEQAQEKWRQTYGNYANWVKPVMLGANASYQKLGQSFDEIGFDALDYRSESRILGAFGVPPELVSTQLGAQGSTFSNKEEARRYFWEDVILFDLGLFIDEYRDKLTIDGAFPYWDLSKVPALRKDLPALIEAASNMIGHGVPPDIAWQTVGVNIPQYEGSSEPFRIVSLVPIGQDVETEKHKSCNCCEPVKQNQIKSMFPDDLRRFIWKAVDNIAVSHENDFGDAAAIAFENDRKEILSILSKEKSVSYQQSKSINWLYVADLISGYLSGKSRSNWRESFVPVLSGLVDDTGKFWSEQLGFQFDIRNIEGELWFQSYVLNFADPITVTSSDEIAAILAQAQKEGWSIDRTSNAIDLVFDQWITGGVNPTDLAFLEERKPFWRRELIARTETTRLQNAGSYNLFKGWGVGKKEWLSTNDDRTRDSHRGTDSQIVNIDENFTLTNGIKLKYPGDPNAPISETANCRCAIAPYIDYDPTI